MARPAMFKRIPISACFAVAALMSASASCDDDDYSPYSIVGTACRDHLDCPAGTACVDVEGGICLVACASDLDCRVSYRCRERNDRDDQGESLVCID